MSLAGSKNDTTVYHRNQNTSHEHAYQSLECETTINTEFSELFSLKNIYVNYKNTILSHIDCFFPTWKD